MNQNLKININVLVEIAEQAGKAIMEIYTQPIKVTHKEDKSPLTEADLQADLIITTALKKHYPGVFILSEESVSSVPKEQESFFLVDPLDGTKEFIKRNAEFTVNIAWVYQQQVQAGVVYVPALQECFKADEKGAFCRHGQGDWQAIRCREKPAKTQSLRIVGSRSHAKEELDQWLDNLEQPYEFMAVGSSLKFCRVAQGAADVYPRFGPTCQWDTAAAQAIVEKAGGEVVDFEGNPLRYGVLREKLNSNFICQVKSNSSAPLNECNNDDFLL